MATDAGAWWHPPAASLHSATADDCRCCTLSATNVLATTTVLSTMDSRAHDANGSDADATATTTTDATSASPYARGNVSKTTSSTRQQRFWDKSGTSSGASERRETTFTTRTPTSGANSACATEGIPRTEFSYSIPKSYGKISIARTCTCN